jgi:phosphotransferase system  glucose/maltose/N-acetylglucosamine-specific IIC component
LQDWVDPVVALVVAALALVLWGAVRGQLRRGGALVVEMAGMAGFTAIALAAVSVDPDLDRYIVAAGWFG